MKTCVKCKIDKSENEFNKSKDRKDGLNPYCKSCCKEWRDSNKESLSKKKKEYYWNNVETIYEKNKLKYINNKEKHINNQRAYYSIPENWVKRMLTKSRKRAKDVGLEFDISCLDLNLPEYCPYLGVKLTYELGKGQLPTNASLDRIDSNKGYVKGNVQIISRKANTMKSNATEQELIVFAKNILMMNEEFV